jgi:integrase
MARYKALVPVWDAQRLMWRLTIPATVSISGKQAKRWFDSRKKALAEVDRLKQHQKQVGSSAKLLDAGRIIEASDCFTELDKIFQSLQSQPTPPGTLKRIVLQEIKLMQQRAKSISVEQLFSSYDLKLQRTHKSDNYRKQFSWLKGYLDLVHRKKVSDLKLSDITVAFAHLPDGNRNSNLRLLRALLNYAVLKGWTESNIGNQIEFVHQPKTDIQPPLPNEVVQKMLDDAATNDLSILPAWAIGFFTGCRSAEVDKLLWADVHIEEKEILLRATISKTKRKRILPVMPCLEQWLNLYFQKVGGKPPDHERILNLTPKQVRDARNRNWQAATNGELGPWKQNCKRITFATNYANAHRDGLSTLALILGHTSLQTSFDNYIGQVSAASARAYFEILPS